MSRYYIAYGSNLNIYQMAVRCPGAKRVGTTTINNHRLFFAGSPSNAHATIEVAPGYSVPVMVWKITKRDEAVLDMYEGVPRYYTKEKMTIRIGDDIYDALVYVMDKQQKAGEPNINYYNVVKVGYRTSGFNIETLETALTESRDRKEA